MRASHVGGNPAAGRLKRLGVRIFPEANESLGETFAGAVFDYGDNRELASHLHATSAMKYKPILSITYPDNGRALRKNVNLARRVICFST
jgi:hypothetical protein